MDIEEIYNQHVEKVYKFFYIKCLDRQLAEDLTSATFMSLIERTGDETFVAQDSKKYLYGIMRRTWINFLRDKYKHNEQALEDIENFESHVDSSIGDYESQDTRARSLTFINRLPEKQRHIVAMRLLDELSIKDICKITGKDKNYIKTTYKRGVRSLRQMTEPGFTNEVVREVL